MPRTPVNAGIAPTPPDDWADDHPMFSAERLQGDAAWFEKNPPTSH